MDEPDYVQRVIDRLRLEASNRGVAPFNDWRWLKFAADTIEAQRVQIASLLATLAVVRDLDDGDAPYWLDGHEMMVMNLVRSSIKLQRP